MRTREMTYPPTEVILIDTSVDTDFDADNPLRAVSIGTAGTLKVDTPNATGVVIPANALAIGVQHVLVITKIYAASTALEVVGFR